MRIGEPARRTGVSERALRYCEAQGLLAPGRRPSGFRGYREEDVSAVRRVRILLAAGLGTAGIRECLPRIVVDDDGLPAPGCPEPVDELEATRAVLDTIVTRELRAGA